MNWKVFKECSLTVLRTWLQPSLVSCPGRQKCQDQRIRAASRAAVLTWGRGNALLHSYMSREVLSATLHAGSLLARVAAAFQNQMNSSQLAGLSLARRKILVSMASAVLEDVCTRGHPTCPCPDMPGPAFVAPGLPQPN